MAIFERRRFTKKRAPPLRFDTQDTTVEHASRAESANIVFEQSRAGRKARLVLSNLGRPGHLR